MHQEAHTDLSQIVAVELFQFSSYLRPERGTSLHMSPCALNPKLHFLLMEDAEVQLILFFGYFMLPLPGENTLSVWCDTPDRNIIRFCA